FSHYCHLLKLHPLMLTLFPYTTLFRSGDYVHTHNVKTNLNDINDYSYQPNFPAIDINEADREVQLYRRANGDVAIRNELWIIPTDRKSTRLNSSHVSISYAVFCLKKKN